MDLRTAHARIAGAEPATDAVYATVVRRGRRRRVARAAASTALVVAVVGGGGALALAAGSGGDQPTTTVSLPPAADVPDSTVPSTEPPTPDLPMPVTGSVALRAPDWEASVAAGEPSVAVWAPYVVTDATGAEVSRGSMGLYGGAIIGAPVGEVTITVATLLDGTPCGFRVTVVIEEDDRGTPLALTCR